MYIVSKFIDYYDDALKKLPCPRNYERGNNNDLSKKEQFSILNHFGANCPKNGLVKNVASDIMKNAMQKGPLGALVSLTKEVVVYLTENGANATGKKKMLADDALREYPNNYCSELLVSEDKSSLGKSLKYVRIGPVAICYWVTNKTNNNDVWASNYNDVGFDGISSFDYDIATPADFDLIEPQASIMFPLYSVDLILIDQKLYAVSFDPAPKLKGTPIELLNPDVKMAEYIQKAVQMMDKSLYRITA